MALPLGQEPSVDRGCALVMLTMALIAHRGQPSCKNDLSRGMSGRVVARTQIFHETPRTGSRDRFRLTVGALRN